MLFDFADRFPTSENGFVDKWKTFSVGLQSVLKSNYNQADFYSGWQEDIEQIFIPLKLFPLKGAGRNHLAKRETFRGSINKLIVFKPVSIDSC